MAANVSIDIDRRTADVLQARAAELGVTVPQLVAALAALDTRRVTRTPTKSPNSTAARPRPRAGSRVLGGTYALQYRYDGSSVLMLRVFHGRERR